MSYVMAQDESVQDNVDNLRAEFGWKEVADGLGRILLSYAVLITGTFVGIGLVVGSLYLAMSPKRAPNDMTHVWVFYVGLGVLSLIGLFAYGMLLAGKWRCLLGAPERNHSKWLMFACMACIVMGPALNIVTGWAGLKKRPEFKQGAAGFKQVKYTELGGPMQIASVGLSLGAIVFFVLFLHSVARCFEDKACTALIALYLTFTALLTGASLYLIFAAPKLLIKPPVLMGLGGGWVISAIWYLVLIAKVRTCIIHGLKQIKSPLEMGPV
jgi:hypothetical protein